MPTWFRRITCGQRPPQPACYTARVTVVDPEKAGHRDQSDLFERELLAVINGQPAISHGHPTVEDAEKWARNTIATAGFPAGVHLRWAVIRAGESPVGPCH